MQNKVLCIIQARMGSTRLPNKVLLKVGGVSLLEYQISRIKRAQLVDKIVVATTQNKNDDAIEKLCRKIGADCFRGSEEDVLDRYYQCSLSYPQFKNIIRITGDCPLIDPAVIDDLVRFFIRSKCDYASNVESGKETFPDGMDVEIFKSSVLEEVASKAVLPSDREHVNEYILRNKIFKKKYLSAPYNWGHFRLTVDEKEDFEVVKFLIKKSDFAAGYLHYISLLTKNPRVMFKNLHFVRNEGSWKSLEADGFSVKNKQLNKIRV